MTRPDLYFAVTVPAAFRDTDEGHAILGRYRSRTFLSSVVALGMVIAGGYRHSTALLMSSIFVQYAGCLAAYLSGRQHVKPHATEPTQVREATLAPSPADLPGGWLLQVGPSVLLAATGLYLRHRWANIPLRFPTHWGLNGEPNGWAHRTLAGVYGPLLIASVNCLILAVISYSIGHWSRPIRLRGQAGNGWSKARK